MIFNHDTPAYRRRWSVSGNDMYNGAYYYSQDICDNIIPNVETDRHWVTINQKGCCLNRSIVFIHNNVNPEIYDWLEDYDDLILVCGIPETCEKVAHLGTPIYLPLSIDVEYVESFKVHPDEMRNRAAFAGRRMKAQNIPAGVDMLTDMPRYELLQSMARYKYIYAVGRTAIEAKVLGCKIKTYDPRFPKTSRWKVVDNLEAAEMLQTMLDEIDKVNDDGREEEI